MAAFFVAGSFMRQIGICYCVSLVRCDSKLHVFWATSCHIPVVIFSM